MMLEQKTQTYYRYKCDDCGKVGRWWTNQYDAELDAFEELEFEQYNDAVRCPNCALEYERANGLEITEAERAHFAEIEALNAEIPF
jgi:DNA-directed RNA polymerase subunit RPC12/RpoP